MQEKNAYSLIEISIVLVIIGIIFSVVIISSSLNKDSVIENVVAEIKDYENSVNQFVSKYNGIPGDFTNTYFISNSTSILPGNGDGIISSDSEALQFWVQLQEADFIQGNFDGISKFVLSTQESIGGIPASRYKQNVGYSVGSDSTLGKVILTLSGYSSSSNRLGAFTPQEALYIDKSLDDGTYNTGLVRAFDATNVAEGSCINGGQYNIDNQEKACYIEYILPNFRLNNDPTPIYNTCDGSSIGFSRRSNLSVCQDGTQGNVIQFCTKDNGIWQELDNLCKEPQCSENIYYNQQISITCPKESSGVVNFICNDSGVFSDENASSLTNADMCITNQECYNSTTGNIYRNVPCPIGYGGSVAKWVQVCSPGEGTWQDLVKNCPPLRCGSNYLGDKNPSPSSLSPCAPEYVPVTSEPYIQVCNFAENGLDWSLIQANCLPDYGSGTCTTGTTRTIVCSQGEKGQIIQTCNSGGYYETTQDTCVPVTCGKYKIGSFRVREDITCPFGQVGQIIEVCNYQDLSTMNQAIWSISYQNCQAVICPAVADGVGNSSLWPESQGGSTVSVNCGGGGTAIRYCNPNGNWSNVADQSCM